MFRPIPPEPNFVELERAELARWRAHRVFDRSVEQRDGRDRWTFYEGPPTANGLPRLHHVWARIYKDLFCRYHTMRGRLVRRRAGWDTHGLPVEVEVERTVGLANKREIEAFGIAEFNRRCRESVTTYVEDWKRLTERIGFWVDLDDAYWTFDSIYVQSVWWHLKSLWDQGLLYEDLKVVPYCPRCGTALSSHELGQPDVYQPIVDEAAYVRLPLVDTTIAEALVVWTTTPWTLLANTGAAVDPELTYVAVDGLVLAEALVEEVLGPDARARITRHFRGAELLGLRYRRPFEEVAAPEAADGWRVVAGDFVTTTEGTGIVHLAPAFGEVDQLVSRANGLPVLNPIDADGCFTDAVTWLAGRPVRDTNSEIVARLSERGLLVRADLYEHPYPHCWRCGTPLIYWGKPSWYVATTACKTQLLAANEAIDWHPASIKDGRFGEWLRNNVDWALSRDRYWGTPLPIWCCQEGHAQCVGSLAKLSELAGRDVTTIDPHRPAIDEVTFPCPDCGGDARRVEAVIDAWFDSGSMPAAQWGYPHQPGSAQQLVWPADFISEAVDQTRGWFYSLLAVNTLVFGTSPYHHVVCLGLMVDAEGRKMSKSAGNAIDPSEVLATRGADPLRWWMYVQGSPWTPTRTSLGAIDAATRETLLTLWHTWSFLATYASLNRFDPADPDIPPPPQRGPLDRWVRSRLHTTVTDVTTLLDSYEPHLAARAIAALVDDLSNWFVRRSRRRFWRTDPGADPADALAAQATLYEALVTLSLLLAPFTPFLADVMWRQLTDADDDASVHLADWPVADGSATDETLEAEMALTRRLVSLGRAARRAANVKVRQPLGRALVLLPRGHPRVLADIVADELNVDELVETEQLSEVLTYQLVPNFRTLGPRLGRAVQEVRAALGSLDAAAVAQALDAGEPFSVELSGGPVELGPDDVEVRVEPQRGFAVSRDANEVVALDLELTEDLRRRGLAREVIRQIQDLRKERGFAVADRIHLHLTGVDDLVLLFDTMAREVLAVELDTQPGSGAGLPLDVQGRDVRVWMTPVG